MKVREKRAVLQRKGGVTSQRTSVNETRPKSKHSIGQQIGHQSKTQGVAFFERGPEWACRYKDSE